MEGSTTSGGSTPSLQNWESMNKGLGDFEIETKFWA
jgi:hypothetical protein